MRPKILPPYPINLGNLEERSVLANVQMALTMMESRSPLTFLSAASDDPHVRRRDITWAERLVSWRPKISIEEGIRRTVDYFRTAVACVLCSLSHLYLARPGDRSVKIVKKNRRPFTAKRVELCADWVSTGLSGDRRARSALKTGLDLSDGRISGMQNGNSGLHIVEGDTIAFSITTRRTVTLARDRGILGFYPHYTLILDGTA